MSHRHALARVPLVTAWIALLWAPSAMAKCPEIVQSGSGFGLANQMAEGRRAGYLDDHVRKLPFCIEIEVSRNLSDALDAGDSGVVGRTSATMTALDELGVGLPRPAAPDGRPYAGLKFIVFDASLPGRAGQPADRQAYGEELGARPECEPAHLCVYVPNGAKSKEVLGFLRENGYTPRPGEEVMDKFAEVMGALKRMAFHSDWPIYVSEQSRSSFRRIEEHPEMKFYLAPDGALRPGRAAR